MAQIPSGPSCPDPSFPNHHIPSRLASLCQTSRQANDDADYSHHSPVNFVHSFLLCNSFRCVTESDGMKTSVASSIQIFLCLQLRWLFLFFSQRRTTVGARAPRGINLLSTSITFQRFETGAAVTTMFKFSSVITVIWAAFFLKERDLRRRLPASILTVVGAILLIA